MAHNFQAPLKMLKLYLDHDNVNSPGRGFGHRFRFLKDQDQGVIAYPRYLPPKEL